MLLEHHQWPSMTCIDVDKLTWLGKIPNPVFSAFHSSSSIKSRHLRLSLLSLLHSLYFISTIIDEYQHTATHSCYICSNFTSILLQIYCGHSRVHRHQNFVKTAVNLAASSDFLELVTTAVTGGYRCSPLPAVACQNNISTADSCNLWSQCSLRLQWLLQLSKWKQEDPRRHPGHQ